MQCDRKAPYILIDRDREVLVLTLNRPERLNAWDTPMRERLGELLVQGDGDPQVRAIVLTGAGDRAFCAGADLKEKRIPDPAERARQGMASWKLFYQRLLNLQKPFIVAMNGLAAGSGFQVAIMADFRVAHAGVAMGQTEILAGIPSITGTTLLMRRLGAALAGELALSGRMMDAAECLRHGLINYIVPPEAVMDQALELAREMGSRSSEAMKQTKAWLHLSELRDLDEAFVFAEKAQVAAMRSGDMLQRIAAFQSRRGKSQNPISN